MTDIAVGHRRIGEEHPPFVIAEVGINHGGDVGKALLMVDAAREAGADCVKFQCHIAEQEMIPNDVVPANASESIWNIIKRCELTAADERRVQKYCEERGILYLSTPFSREASDRLEQMGVSAFKIGSGECNNLPLLDHVARKGKPIILSTGMNDLASIARSVETIGAHGVPVMLMHVTSMYPTPYDKVRLGAITEMRERFGLPVGLSDHSIGIYTCVAAVALGACALEKHFTVTRDWPGEDIPISLEPQELADLVRGSRAVWEARGGSKTVLPEEQPVIDFAYASVVTVKPIAKGERFSLENTWVKRPGTGPLHARDLGRVLGAVAKADLPANRQVAPADVEAD